MTPGNKGVKCNFLAYFLDFYTDFEHKRDSKAGLSTKKLQNNSYWFKRDYI
jgi:hypothetical protein